jgi:hypothetical protein
VSGKKHCTGRASQTIFLAPKVNTKWQPEIGQRVVVRDWRAEFQKKFLGKIGEVVRNQGLGYFQLRFEDGETCKFASALLKKPEVAQK